MTAITRRKMMSSAANEPARMRPLVGSYKLEFDLLFFPIPNRNEWATLQQATHDIEIANWAAGKRVVPKKRCSPASPAQGRGALRYGHCFA